MKLLKIRASVTVFLLFFGISLLEAYRTRNWMNVTFWIAIAGMFLIADNITRQKVQKTKSE